MSMIRYARWAAVSTKGQAKKERVSLDVQLEKTLEACEARHWKESAGPFVVRGESRTNWLDLSAAEEAIPELGDMLDAAQRHEFDVLVMYDFDRLRDLLFQVSRSLADYGVQMYQLGGSEPVDPSVFDPDAAIVQMEQTFGQMKSTMGMSTLRRHHRDKMPERITRKGLHAGLGPTLYGYTKPYGKDTVLEIEPVQAQVIIQIKDWFLAGISVNEIAERLNAQNIPPPRGRAWSKTAVAYKLTNPFYAGIVSYGIRKRLRDRRTGTVKIGKGKPVYSEGKHVPLWDKETYDRIIAEFERRGKGYPGHTTRALSRLLRCWCGRPMWAQGKRDEAWACKGHLYVKHEDAMRLAIEALNKEIENAADLELPEPEDKRPLLEKEISDLQLRRKRWMDVYELGQLNPTELSERIESLDAQIETAKKKIAEFEKGIVQVDRTRESLLALTDVEDYIREGDPVAVNADLREFVEAFVFSPEKVVKIRLRTGF